MEETFYKCGLCRASYYLDEILRHLNGYKHKINCVKHCDMTAYSKIRSMSKYKASYKLPEILKQLINKYGQGRIAVDKVRKNKDSRLSKTNRLSANEKYCTRHNVGDGNYELLSSRPDTSYFDFYCKICDAHMNSKIAWVSHVYGSKHKRKCAKKSEQPSCRTKSVEIPNTRSVLMDQLDKIQEPVVGLNAIQEIRTNDQSPLRYKCFICCSCITPIHIVDHILSFNHRKNFLEKIKHPRFQILKDLKLPYSNEENIIFELCTAVESEKGRGLIEVRYAKY